MRKLTDSEKEVLNIAKKEGYEWVSRDSDEELYAYKDFPIKTQTEWTSNYSYYAISDEDELDFIKWSDDKPYPIDILLKADNTKPSFKIENYQEKYAMHCNKEEKAIVFCNILDILKRRWNWGGNYLKTNYWHENKENTCYAFNYDCIIALNNCIEDYVILEFDDFDWKTTMKNILSQKENKLLKLLSDVEEKEKEYINPKWQKPKLENSYFTIRNDGSIIDLTWRNTKEQNVSWEQGNDFHTYKEAEFEMQRRKVLHHMQKFEEDKSRPWDGKTEHYCFGYDDDGICIKIEVERKSNDIYFETEETAKKCLKEVGKEDIEKYYFKVK